MSDRANYFTRDDTFFGVCQALGDDIGINADWLRIGTAAVFFLAPIPVLIGYCALGLIIAAVRWWVPDPVAVPVAADATDAAIVDTAAAPEAHFAPTVEAEDAREPMPLAA